MIPMESVRYFDIETEGRGLLDGEEGKNHRIIFVNLNGKHLLLRDQSEEEILRETVAWLVKPDQLPLIGKALIFDLWFVATRCKVYGIDFDPVWWLLNWFNLDMKEIAVLLNGGRFQGYPKWIDRKGKPNGSIVPEWFKQGRWDLIEKYSEEERTDVFKFYEWVGSYLAKLGLQDRPY